MEQSKGIMEVFRIFQNKESYFEDIHLERSNRLMVMQLLIVCVFTFCYGAVMGSYHSFIQAISAGVKVTMLFLCAIVICFPSFFIIQQVLGSRMTVRQMVMIVMSGLVLISTIIFSFIPIVVFFQVTGGNYHFLQLLHVAIFIFAGFFGLRLMVEALKYACDTKAIYPEIGVRVFKVWVVILVFVSVQLAWNLRPFLCEKHEEFKVFRKHEGNFYTAIVYSIQQLTNGKPVQKASAFHGYPSDTLYCADTVMTKIDSIKKMEN
jgi:hypothetical protein